MKVVLALGNPGRRYRDTRHNVGWWLADRLASRWSFPPFRRADHAAETEGEREGRTVRILKPLTYVNRSGRVVRRLADQAGFRVEDDLLVVVDDVDLPPGALRLRARGSSGGHRGLESVEEAAGTREYARLRIGVGRPEDPRVELADWVLAPPSGAEEEAILSTFGRAAEAVDVWLSDGAEAAMNEVN